MNLVLIAPTFNDDTDLTIAVNLGGPISKAEQNITPPSQPVVDESEIQSGIKKFIQTIQGRSSKTIEKNWGIYNVADKAFDAMQSTIGHQEIAAYPPDIEIIIARNACGTLEFERTAEMIDLGGYQKAKEFAQL